MSVTRVAVIYDNSARPETTGVYCFKALQSLVRVHHVLPGEAGRLDPSDHDLFIRIDDGIDQPLPERLRPLAWWAIDTHLGFERCFRTAMAVDLTFAAQRSGALLLESQGVAKAEWLPLACDPDVHRPLFGGKRFDFCFVGNVHPGHRRDRIELLKTRYPRHFVGNAYFDDLARIHSESHIVFNCSIAEDLNMRVFESLACGSLLLTDELPAASGMADLFQDGRHLATYSSTADLLDRMAFLLANNSVRARIEQAGRDEVVAHHTYRHRMARILERAASLPRCFPVASSPPGRFVSASHYFEWERPELLTLVPQDARDIVELGCGAGRLGAAIKRRQLARITGIEVDPVAAASARTRLDEVVESDIERLDAPFPPASFDTAICGDVLEHLRDPLAALRTIRTWLRPGGTLILSLPNMRHHSVIRGLLDGNWTYEPAGLLDHTHLRFFTRREVEKLLVRSGFESGPLQVVPGPGHAEWVAEGRPSEARVHGLRIGPMPPGELEEFFTYQWIGAVRTCLPPTHGLTSIIVVTFNELAYTRRCLDTLRLLTDEPFELIVVDNGSTDGTPEHLAALAAVDSRVRFLLNSENRGFPAAANQGLGFASGEQLLLLNNDTIPTTGWLKHLLDAMNSDQSWGLLGPVSNRVSGDQQIEVTYRDLEGLDGFAWDLGQARSGAVVETDRLVGFCLMIRRAVFETIGGLDESFGLGNFEDDDYCLRARQAGYRCGIVQSSFVHHFGSITFRSAGIDHAGLLLENEERFRRKWATRSIVTKPHGVQEAVSRSPEHFESANWELGVHPHGGLILRHRLRVSGCLIVRDNARTIRECLTTLKPWVDELVVVDTGSTDETPKMAESLGARVFRFPWCDDFSAARNQSVRHARGEWIFWMDSDDTIDEQTGRALRSLVDGPHADEVLGYVMGVRCPGPDGTGDTVMVDHVKLFRNQARLRFEGRIHEQILPAIRRAGGTVAWTDLFVTHSGHDHSPEGQIRKRERDLKLLALELEDRPSHPFTLFNLGMTYSDMGQHAEAIRFLEGCLDNSMAGDSHRRKAHALLVHSNLQLGSASSALTACERGLAECPDDLELRFRYGSLLHIVGRHADAINAFRCVLADASPRYFASIDLDLKGYKAHQNLAAIYLDLGDWESAASEWRSVVELAPSHVQGWSCLGDALLRLKRWSEAEAVVRHLKSASWEFEALLLEGRIAIGCGDRNRARSAWEKAVATGHPDLEPLRLLCRLHFEDGSDAEAERTLRELIHRDPLDPDAHHNLGSVLFRRGDATASTASFLESLRLRPDSAETWRMLGQVCRQNGNEEQAEAALQAARNLDPPAAGSGGREVDFNG